MRSYPKYPMNLARRLSENSLLPTIRVEDTVRNSIIAAIGEFVGTFMFLFFSFAGTQISNTPMPPPGSHPNTSNLLFAALSFGFSLTVNVWAFYRVTGGLFNPSVSLALMLVGAVTPLRAVLMIIVQLLGGMAAAGVVSALFPGPLNVGTRLGGGASRTQGLFIEMFLTAQLVFVIQMLAVTKHKSTYLAPVGIGLTFFLCELIGIYYTGGSLNPARSLGPDVANASFPNYHWIYWIGPGLGSLLATAFYTMLRTMRYETCNPGQDADRVNVATGEVSQSHCHHGQDMKEARHNSGVGGEGGAAGATNGDNSRYDSVAGLQYENPGGQSQQTASGLQEGYGRYENYGNYGDEARVTREPV